MKRAEKITIALLVPVSLILLLLYILTTEHARSMQNMLVYPEGGLSDSLFVQQNNTYTKNDALPVSFSFNALPYYIDTMKGSQANVGQGWIIQASDSMFIYISEYDDSTSGASADGVILKEFPSAILIDYDPVYTYTQKIRSQTGYINGFAADYAFEMITVSNGRDARACYFASYDLKPIDPEEHDHMLIAAVTTAADSQSFAVCKNMVDAMARSIRYDEKLNKKIMESKKEQAEEAAAENADETAEDVAGKESADTSQPDELRQYQAYDYDFDSLLEEGDVDARFVPLVVERDYEDMYICFTMDDTRERFVPGQCGFTLYNAGREKISTPELSEDGLVVTFHVGPVSAGQHGLFAIKITHYSDFGKGTVQVKDGTGEQGNQQ